MMQRLGERIDEEELHAVKQMNADQSEGEKKFRYCLKKWTEYGSIFRMHITKR